MTETVKIGQVFGREEEVAIGDFVGFKDGVEQCGKLVEINGPWLTLSVYDSIAGERYNVQEHRSRCWAG
jgi:hypothetical protein